MQNQEMMSAVWLRDKMQEFMRAMSYYRCAMMEIETKFNVLNQEYMLTFDWNPISTIKTRLKTLPSIERKLQKKGLPMTLEAMEQNLTDIAGVRVICTFVDDVYRVAHMLSMQSDVKVLVVKDYIRNPKPNGYRSYHMIVEIPVFFSNHAEAVRVEVQIRTIAMDFWATLEHQLNYKKDLQGSEEISGRLAVCAESIASVDKEMQEIREMVEQLGGPVGKESSPAQNLLRLFG